LFGWKKFSLGKIVSHAVLTGYTETALIRETECLLLLGTFVRVVRKCNDVESWFFAVQEWPYGAVQTDKVRCQFLLQFSLVRSEIWLSRVARLCSLIVNRVVRGIKTPLEESRLFVDVFVY
jgi:hypothetical protein